MGEEGERKIYVKSTYKTRNDVPQAATGRESPRILVMFNVQSPSGILPLCCSV